MPNISEQIPPLPELAIIMHHQVEPEPERNLPPSDKATDRFDDERLDKIKMRRAKPPAE